MSQHRVTVTNAYLTTGIYIFVSLRELGSRIVFWQIW